MSKASTSIGSIPYEIELLIAELLTCQQVVIKFKLKKGKHLAIIQVPVLFTDSVDEKSIKINAALHYAKATLGEVPSLIHRG